MQVDEMLQKNVTWEGDTVKVQGSENLNLSMYDTYRGFYDYNPPTYIKTEDDYSRAFRVAKMLLQKKYLQSHKLDDFISLVESIAREL